MKDDYWFLYGMAFGLAVAYFIYVWRAVLEPFPQERPRPIIVVVGKDDE